MLLRGLLLFLVLAGGRALAQSNIASPTTLALAPLSGDSRLGINLNIGGAAWTETYLFDTGSYPFISGWASGAPWWGAADVNTSVTNDYIYGPGSGQNKLDYHLGTANLTITDGTISLTAPGSNVSQIFTGYTNSDPSAPVADWQPNTTFNNALTDAVTTGDPPFASMAGPFFGILGADFTAPGQGFYGMLSQFTYGAGISQGFIVNGATASLTIGLDADTIADFSVTYAMNPAGGGAYDQAIVSPDFTVTHGDTTLNLMSAPTLFDTGTPPEAGVVIEQGTAIDLSAFVDGDSGHLRHGTTFTMLIGGAPYTLTSTSDHPILVFDTAAGDAGQIIYGLNFFQNYEVMYNLDSATVGVRSIPEPGTWALLGLGLGAVALRFRRNRQGSKA